LEKNGILYKIRGLDAKIMHIYKYKIVYVLIFVSGIFSAFGQAELENLGKEVNSKVDDLAPVITPDGKTIYFTRNSHPENQKGSDGTEDVWVTAFDEGTETWSKARNMGKSFNDQKINGIQSISPDGNTIMIFGAYENGEYKGLGFSMRKRTEEGWSAPEEIKINGLRGMAQGIYLGAYMANSGKVMILYFSEKPKDKNSDLYVSFKQDNGTWTRPKSLGRRVNSNRSDSSPFIASDNTTLYFASDRPGGKGGFDIYQTKRLDDSWMSWSVPQNLGEPINTAGFEANYSVPASGEFAYLASGQNSLGGSDLIRVKLSEDNKPEPVVLVSGYVLNSETGEPVEADIKVYQLPDNEEVAIAQSFGGSGSYQTTLLAGEDYVIVASKSGYASDTATVNTRTKREYQEIERSFGLRPGYGVTSSGFVPEPPLDTKLSSLYFDTGRIDIQESSKTELERILFLLRSNPKLKVWIRGHADIRGSAEANHILGENRAKYVRAYLIANGIESYRLKYISYGNWQPAASNRTAEGRQMNRRVEIHYDLHQ
jgi:OOP family OmpA-OmpF porin